MNNIFFIKILIFLCKKSENSVVKMSERVIEILAFHFIRSNWRRL